MKKSRIVSTKHNDVGIIGECIRHPKSGVEVIKWRDTFYYLDGSEIDNWELNKIVYFQGHDSHAFNVRNFD